MKSSSVDSILFNHEKNQITKISHEVAENSPGICYLVAYINIGYFACFIPFRYKYCHTKNCYEMVENGPQKVGAVLFHAVYILHNILFYMDRIITYISSPNHNPLQCLNFVEITINILFAFTFSYILLFKRHHFQVLLDLYQKHRGTLELQQPIWNWRFGLQFGICVYFLCFGFIQETFSKLSQYHSGLDRGDSFIPGSVRSCWFVIACYTRAVGESSTVLVFAFGWLLKALCENLKKEILDSRTNYAQIMEQYLGIKAINEGINHISKYLLLFYAVGSVPYISEPMMSLSITQPFVALSFVSSTIVFVFALLGSAEANIKAAELKDALILRNNNKQLLAAEDDKDDILRVSILLSEFSTPSIGLRGMSFFTVTYGFLGVMLSQCVVYALIILQLKIGTDPVKN